MTAVAFAVKAHKVFMPPRSRWPCFRPRTRRRTPAQMERLASGSLPCCGRSRLLVRAKLLPLDAICASTVAISMTFVAAVGASSCSNALRDSIEAS